MEKIVQNTGRIEFLYHDQMIRNMLERVSIKNKNVLSSKELEDISAKFLDSSRDYSQRLAELTTLHSYSGEQMKSYVAGSTPPILNDSTIESLQPSMEKPKVLIKTPLKPFNFQ